MRSRIKKLTDEQVRDIAATMYNGEPLAAIAARYGVSMSCVSQIRCGARKTLVTGMERRRCYNGTSALGRLTNEQWKNLSDSEKRVLVAGLPSKVGD